MSRLLSIPLLLFPYPQCHIIIIIILQRSKAEASGLLILLPFSFLLLETGLFGNAAIPRSMYQLFIRGARTNNSNNKSFFSFLRQQHQTSARHFSSPPLLCYSWRFERPCKIG